MNSIIYSLADWALNIIGAAVVLGSAAVYIIFLKEMLRKIFRTKNRMMQDPTKPAGYLKYSSFDDIQPVGCGCFALFLGVMAALGMWLIWVL